MDGLTLSLIVIFLLITLAPFIARRIGLPVIVVEIIVGIFLGVSWLNIIPDHQLFTFLASFGLVYLMFLAGIELDARVIRRNVKRTTIIAFGSLSLPFVSGLLLAPLIGTHPLILGTILCTTSIGLILPIVREIRRRKRVSQILLGSVVLVDVVSLFVLALSLSFIQDTFGWSFIYSALAVTAIFFVPWLLTRNGFQKKISNWIAKKARYDAEVRLAFALIFILGAFTEVTGFHSIIGAFIAGLIISEITPNIPTEKLKSFGFGFFIPLFFILIGSQVNIPALFSDVKNLYLLFIIIVVGFASKLIGVGFAARLVGYNGRESLALGLFHTARLSLIIAVVEIARRQGLVNENLFSIFVLLAILTSVIGPSLGKYVLPNKRPI